MNSGDLLKMDPLEFRLKNAAKEGDVQANDVRVSEGLAVSRLWRLLVLSEHYRSKLTGLNRGRGVAAGYWMNAGLHLQRRSTTQRRWHRHFGSRAPPTLEEREPPVAMQLAESLGIRAEDVIPSVVDTDSVGYTEVTGGSRVTYATGYAAYEAGQASPAATSGASRQIVES